MKRHIKFLKRAQKEAQRSEYIHQIGCILVVGNRIISTGFNQIRYKGRGQKYSKFQGSLHAERDCISKVDREDFSKSKATLYVFRDGKDHPMLAKPCDQCWWLIEEIGFIKKVVYTTNEFPYFEIARVK